MLYSLCYTGSQSKWSHCPLLAFIMYATVNLTSCWRKSGTGWVKSMCEGSKKRKIRERLNWETGTGRQGEKKQEWTESWWEERDGLEKNMGGKGLKLVSYQLGKKSWSGTGWAKILKQGWESFITENRTGKAKRTGLVRNYRQERQQAHLYATVQWCCYSTVL